MGAGVGLFPHVPNYSAASRLYNKDGTLETLTRLVEESAWPVREFENGGTVAIDSTGFSISAMGSYNTQKHDPERRHHFVKAHVVCGSRTQIVIGVKLTDENGADCPQFIPLLNRAWQNGFRPADVAADKAYLSRGNLTAADRLGIDPFIPMKVNSIGSASGCPIWSIKYHQFHSRPDEFFKHYHARSSVESVFSSVKRLLGEGLLSHTPRARYNEVLARLWAYNIGVIIRISYELGFDAGEAIQGARPSPPPEGLGVAVSRESNSPAVNQIAADSPGLD
jgi:transposase